MKIVSVPEGLPYEDMQALADKLKHCYPSEYVLIITDAIAIYDFPLEELHKLRDIIDKEISNQEMMIPGERIKP